MLWCAMKGGLPLATGTGKERGTGFRCFGEEEVLTIEYSFCLAHILAETCMQ